jgi:hypothetical protein
MSRHTINEELYNLGNQLKRGMDSITIVDPGRLRVPFGGGSKTPRKQSWMTVSAQSGMEPYRDVEEDSCMQEVVMDLARQPNIKLSLEPMMTHALTPINRQALEHHLEVKGWTLSLGYSLFGLALALCNLLSTVSASMVCTVMSPIPMACLLLHALFSMESGVRHVGSYNLEVWCLLISALLIPTACVSWSLYVSMPLTLILSLSIVCSMRQRNVLVWVCMSGVCLSLVVAVPTSAMNILEPRWGMTVALFFMGLLCFLAGMGYGAMEFKIKYV